MNKKQLFVAVAILALAGVAGYMLKDWLKPTPIQIECVIRRSQPARRPQNAFNAPSGKPGYNVTFAFSQKVSLTSVKVVSVDDAATNKYPHAFWNLVCASNPVPTKALVYGGWARGLQPSVKGLTADQLEPGKSYRILVQAGSMTAQQDFQVPP
ncbi:MAG: hypothetical protein RLY20_634 [Verrucomicrobiota bacterium]|jgi:hypothetical protein